MRRLKPRPTTASKPTKIDAGTLENLFRNAVEHGGDDVTVSVGTESWGFYVTDDGPGIPDGTADLFEPGYSTADDGTGSGCVSSPRSPTYTDGTCQSVRVGPAVRDSN